MPHKQRARTKKKPGALVTIENNRYLPRWEVENKVIYLLDDETKADVGLSKDLSACGTCLFADYCFQSNQKLQLKIFLSDDFPLKVKGRIVWCKPYKKGFMVGVAFDKISQKNQQLILDHAFDLDKYKVLKLWVDGE